MRTVLLLLSGLVTVDGDAQNYLGLSRNNIVRYLTADFKASFDSSSFRLDAHMDGQYPMDGSYFFDDEFDDEGWCDSVVIRYACGACFQGHLDHLVSAPSNDWLLMPDGRYVTPRDRYATRVGKGPRMLALPLLTIDRHEGEAICDVMTFSYLLLPKDETKALLKRLRCEKG